MKKIFLFLIFLFMFSFISAQPPGIFETNNLEGYKIIPGAHSAIKTGQNYTFNLHLANASNGYPVIDGTLCQAHSYGLNGDHLGIVSINLTGNDFDYSFLFTGGNFSTRGQYLLKQNCNSSIAGDTDEIFFYVTDFGLNPAGDNLTIFIYIIFLLAIAGTIIYLFISILNLATFNQTIFGVLAAWSSYLLLILANYLARAYLLDYFIEDITDGFITWAGYPLIIIPLISLVVTMFKKGTDKTKPITPQALTGIKLFKYG